MVGKIDSWDLVNVTIEDLSSPGKAKMRRQIEKFLSYANFEADRHLIEVGQRLLTQLRAEGF
jgi:hypothetical protein